MKKKLLVLSMVTIMCVGLSLKANASGGEVNEATETIASDKETLEKTVETYPSTITKFGSSSIIENTLERV